jgi:hypothetical protein
MYRKTCLFASLLVMLPPFACAQQSLESKAPAVPEDSLRSQQLIAWSHLQKPRPIPQPLPPPDTQPEAQPTQSASPQSPIPQTSTETFTGRIVRAGDKYVLKAAGNNVYQLDEQDSAKRFEDKDVRVIGTLDKASNTIHVVRIELLS